VPSPSLNEKRRPTGPPHGDTAVAFRDVSLAFDDHVVLQDLTFDLPRGATRVLLGASGTGKSLVLKLILGLLRPDAGRIFVNGERVDNMPEDELLALRGDIGMLFQETALFDSLTVGENVGFRLSDVEGLPAEQVRGRVEEVLTFVGLGDFTDRLPSTLSGGQRRRVAIARAMAAKPSLLLFDDPTTGLDPIIATTVDDEIVKLRDRQHVSCLIVTHQIRDAFYIATHQAVRRDGQARIVPGDARTAAPAGVHGAARRPNTLPRHRQRIAGFSGRLPSAVSVQNSPSVVSPSLRA
jgi:phospholipid/cholesterol/gamma-HCH transport system ATP-binding protein